MKRQISAALSAAILMSVVPAATQTAFAEGDVAYVTYNYGSEEHTRRMEALDRGLVAVKTDGGVFLSWRLLGTESTVADVFNAPGFDVYKNGDLLAHVDESTNYLDASGAESDTYSVAIDGGEQCEPVTVNGTDYIEIPLTVPDAETIYYPDEMNNSDTMGPYSFTPSDVSCGDLDGDGEYELVIKWVSSERDVGSPGDPAYSGTVRFAAYKLDGTKLWDNDIALGRNVYSSAHTVQFLVYDFDGDGKAEMMCQTSLGSKDALGNYVTNAAAEGTAIAAYTDDENESADFRGYGRITTGEEFLTVFNGETGAAMDTIDLPTARVSSDSFGDDFGNRCNRFLADVAYLDGEKPYGVYWRGYYHGRNGQQRTSVCGVSFDGARLSADYRFDTLDGQPGYVSGNEQYVGNGNHNLTVADVDNDGCDEVISGAMCLESDTTADLAVKWCTFRGHGDALHIGDYDPTHEGMEFFTVHEETTTVNGVTYNFGMTVLDAATGEQLFHSDGSKDTGRGLMANVGMGGYYQITGASSAGNYMANGNGAFSSAPASVGTNFRIFWDADLYDETLDGTSVSSWNGSYMEQIFNADGCVKVNGTKSNPSLQADLFGDWREELVYPTSDYTALRVYTTTELTDYKLPTLMHDPVYRSGVAAEQTAYNQPPHIGFYLSEELFKPAVESLEVMPPTKTEYLIDDTFDTAGMVVTAYYADGTSEEITGYIVNGFDSSVDGEQTVTVTFGGCSASFTINVNSGFEIDENGLITAYTGGLSSAVLPASVGGVTVTGFADGVLINSGLTSITVKAEKLAIGENVFPEGIVIGCTQSSDIYAYAVEYGIETELIDTRDYTFNIKYDETEYTGFYMTQSTSAQNRAIGHITYGVGGRPRGGDGTTGFSVAEQDEETVMRVGVGQFASSGRNAYMTLNDLPSLSDSSDTVFETDILFNDKETTDRDGNATVLRAVMTLSDTDGEADSVSTSLLGLESGVWYTYKLICHNGVYYRMILDAQGDMVSFDKLGATTATMPVSDVKFLQESGDFGQGRNTYLLLDNTKMYMNTELTDNTVVVTDSDGDPIPYAAVTAGDTSVTVGADGRAALTLLSGIYDAVVSAEGYNSETVSINAYRTGEEIQIRLTPEDVPMTGISMVSSLSLKPGMTGSLNALPVPANATDTVMRFESSDTSVAAVDENGTVTAVSAGTATITAYGAADESVKAECTVTVISDEYEPVVTAVTVTGPETAYIPNTGVVNEAVFTAAAYDQNGVAMDVDFTWSADNGMNVTGGVLEITSAAEAGTVTVTASADGVSGSAEITLADVVGKDGIIAKLTFENEFLIHISTDESEKDSEYITYQIGHRSSDGASTYIKIDNSAQVDGRQVMQVGVNKYTDGDRYPRVIFKNAPAAYESGMTYVLEADIKFSGGFPMQLRDSGASTIISLSAESLGAETGKWYHYMLVYNDGQYTQTVFDESGAIVSVSDLTVYNTSPIAMLTFERGDAPVSVMNFADISYYATTEPTTAIVTVQVKDEDGSPISGATVSAGAVTAVTGETGKAFLELPKGVYVINAYVNDEFIGSVAAAADGGTTVYTIYALPEPEIVSVNGSIINTVIPSGTYSLYAARYENGTLAELKAFDASAASAEYDAGFAPDKVFMWDGMTPVDIWTAE